MRSRNTSAPETSPVLRGVELHAHPLSLGRPGRVSQGGPNKPQAQVLVATTAPSVDAAVGKARAEGYDAGFEAGQARAQQALDASVEEMKALGLEEGRRAGLQEGLELAGAQNQRTQEEIHREAQALQARSVEKLDGLLRSACAGLVQWRMDWEDEIVAIIHEAVCRILGDAAPKATAVRSTVRQLLAEHGARAQIAVHVHPDDLAALAGVAEEASANWKWVADKTVSLGGVILRSPEGSLDARLETQLQSLREALMTVRLERASAARGEQA